MSFPASLPSYTITSGSEHPGDAAGGLGLSGLLNAFETDIVAIGTKIGTGASTPSSGKVLRSGSSGTSTWGAVVLTTDVTGTLPLANGGTGQTTLAGLLGLVYPIGSIYFNAGVSTNPSSLLGFGTWTAWGSGRVPVGVDGAQTEFDTLEETGGDKNTEAHKHWISGASWDDGNFSGKNGNTQDWGLYADAGTYSADDPDHAYGRYSKTFGTGTAGNLQPYITVYMWKRTA